MVPNANIYDIKGLVLDNPKVDVKVKTPSAFDWGTILINIFLPLLLIGGLLFFLLPLSPGSQ